MAEYDMSIHSNPDARAWARFFVETYNREQFAAPDEEMMVGWFANAMMAMHDSKAPECAALRARAERAERERDAAVRNCVGAAEDALAAERERVAAERRAERAEAVESAARRVVAEYRTDLKAGRWSDALLAAMDDLRAALAARTTAAQLADGGADATAPSLAKLLKPDPSLPTSTD